MCQKQQAETEQKSKACPLHLSFPSAIGERKLKDGTAGNHQKELTIQSYSEVSLLQEGHQMMFMALLYELSTSVQEARP